MQALTLVAGLGVAGDVHAGARVRHRSRVRADPQQPNLRQVHLIHSALFQELASAGHSVTAGELGENVTTTGLDLLGLPTGTVLRVGGEALIALTGLRNPCAQIEAFQPGLLQHLAHKNEAGEIIRKAGVMAVVIRGGQVQLGDPIAVSLPPEPHSALVPV